MTGGAEGRLSGRRIALLLEYDGSAYCGSQYQQNGRSIQEMLEAAINNLTARTARVAFAGRTDAGVHAIGQVAAFDPESVLSLAEIKRGLNRYLPEDIVVRQTAEVEPTFDPRRDAVARRYEYRIDNRPTRPALERARVAHVAKPLDVAAMQAAASRLVGKHDFAAFAPPTDKLTQRTLTMCEVSGASGVEVVVVMEAQAFLPHQVRRTVGPLIEIGLGRMTSDELQALLEQAVPSTAGPAAPAKGLCLVSVRYEESRFVDSDGQAEEGE